MAIILEEIYEVALHRYNMKLVAGGRGLRNLVDWVHTVEEMDYVSFLKGRELIITTGIREKDEETLVRFVKSLHETGASGLVINIGKYITRVPRGVIAYSEEAGFPVFTLPWEVHLVDFNRDLCNLIYKTMQEQDGLETALQKAIFSHKEEQQYLEAFKNACTENTIAIMVEPVQGEGGVHPATPEFLKGLREFCDEKGMLLLLDEVQTGWCRTGAVMSYMNYGVKPDIVSMAKGLGGGMPIGAICATEEVSKAFTPGSHGTTFGGHPISCAAALAEVEELLDKDLAGNAKKVGDYFAAKLEKLPHVKEVRHQGLLVGVEFDDEISGVEVKHGCLDRKLLITAIGTHVIRMIPPLIVTEEQCDEACAIIEEAVKALC